MTRILGLAVVAAAFLAQSNPPAVTAQAPTRLAGTWSLNRSLSEFPKEIGFNPDWVRAGFDTGQDRGASGGARGGGGGGGRGGGRRGGSGGSGGGSSRPFTPQRESADDAKRVQVLTEEVRNPPAFLTIADSGGAITFTSDRGEMRTFHPGRGREELHLGDLPVPVTARWEEDRLIVLYDAEEGHQLRYTYSPTADPRRLRVDVQFVERGGGDSVVRVYDPATETTTTTGNAGGVRPAAPVPPAGSVPAAPGGATAMQPPGSELKGLSVVGVVVEDLDGKAVECGLNHAAIEAAVSKALSNAGLKVAVNTDEDTYIYVNVMTTTMATGFCASRYDVSLFTHTTATLSYQSKPSLVQVALLHKGGFSGGSASQHAAGVLQGITQYAVQFATQIRDANK